ncbi:hypothetical protein FACS1894204_07870 [Synergistales bacterium]|nr:hypothetical protein FACS1894204_07870 [Synergistales bacterium]
MATDIVVIIPTKNRAAAIEKYALSSLARSAYRDFVCVVWDASNDELTKGVVEKTSWNFEALWFRAPRIGSSSQRNDAVLYAIDRWPLARFIVFMDDDAELSPDALGGVIRTFTERGAVIVNIPQKPIYSPSLLSRLMNGLKRILGMNRHGVTSFLYNYGGGCERSGEYAEWASGCGMGVDVNVFKGMRVFFPEEFQRFGGYALGEDLAFSFFIHKKMGGSIVNALSGHLMHHIAPGARLDIENMAAAKWYNFHLLFDAIYGDATGFKKPRLMFFFKLFMYSSVLKLLLRARSLDIAGAARGVRKANDEATRYRARGDNGGLFGYSNNPARPRWPFLSL